MVCPAHSEIQAWIERISRHIQGIIRRKGGNEHEEDRMEFKRSWAGTRLKGKLSKHTYLQPQGLSRKSATIFG
jgi:hypothetical protein